LINPYTGALLPTAGDLQALLPKLQILSLTAVDREHLWVGTNKGLYLIHTRQGVVAHYQHDPADPASISADTVYTTHADASGQLWIGTSDGGLNQLLGSVRDPGAVRFQRYSPQQLNAHSIYGIESDDGGQLWLATNNGLLQLDPVSGARRLFGPADGAQDREYNFGAHHRAANGMLYFGGRNGYNAFDPARLELEQPAAQVTLLEFEPRGELPVDMRTSREGSEPLDLTYVQNAFTVRFALLDYGSPNNNTFSYRLVGFDSEWTDYSADHSATYTNLDPGSYRFEVRGRSSSSVPGKGTRSVPLSIQPPPWATSTAFSAYALLLIFALGSAVQWVRRREARRRAYQLELEHEVAQRTVELQESNRQLAQATRAKSDFLARMSHEIRTPMNGIFGTAELLLRGSLGSRQKQQVNIIHKSCGALISLINDILDFSKIEAGKLTLEAVPFDLLDVVHEVAQLFVHQAQQKSLQLFINSSCLALPVTGDPLRVRQVISNLVGNAIKFTEHGYVELAVEQTSEGIAIAVRDTGIGIEPAAQVHIFEDFSQADGSTSRRFGGTGLGLSICSQLAELMGGCIELTSQVGEGSTFTVLLPLSASPAAAFTVDRELEVLILVSHSHQAEILCSTLNAHGLKVAVRSDAESAFLDRALIERIDALICDPLSSIGLDQWLEQAHRSKAEPLQIVTIGDCAFEHARGCSIVSVNAPPAPAELMQALTAAPETMAAADEEDLPTIALQGPLLLVEDNPVNQEVITGMLETLGITPVVANDGPTALQRCAEQAFQVILLDCGLPGMDGLEVTRTLRAGAGPNQASTIVALTANSLSGERDNCLAAGMDDFLAKPCTLIDLARTLARWVDPARPFQAAPLTMAPANDSAASTEPVPSATTTQTAQEQEASRLTTIDQGALDQIRRLEKAGRTGMLDLLVKMYQADLQTALGQLSTPEFCADREAVRSLSHKLKSSSANVGALAYAESWAELETACRGSEDLDLEAMIGRLATHAEAVLGAIEAAAQHLAESA
ncbi:MAG: ATP-binding protein, partial [Pseudomonadota bacterium]